jgi:hypothetical protein
MMSLRAHTANPVCEDGHIFDPTADTETLKPAQFGDLEIDILDIALIIEEDLNLSMTF